MKAPTYIVKNVYQEQLKEDLYQKHVDKVIHITSKSASVQKEQQLQMAKIEKYRKAKERSRKFKDQQLQLDRQYTDKSLIKKFIETQQGKYSHPSIIKKSSLIANYHKKQAYERELENVRLGQRIIGLPSVINKKTHDQFFTQHSMNLQLASRVRGNTKSKIDGSHVSQKDNNQCIFEQSIQFKLVVFNKEIQNKDSPIEYQYSIEALMGEQSLYRTNPTSFQNLQNLHFKVPFTQQQYDLYQGQPMTLKVWKLRHNSEIYMGQIYLGMDEQFSEKDIMKKVNDDDIWNGFIQL